MKIGAQIKRRRVKLGLSQYGAAEVAGMPRSQFSDLEADRFSPNLDTLERVATALDCRISDLLDE